MFQVVPNSEKYYCRVVDCHEFTLWNIPYGYCRHHLIHFLEGTRLEDKYGFPDINSKLETNQNAITY